MFGLDGLMHGTERHKLHSIGVEESVRQHYLVSNEETHGSDECSMSLLARYAMPKITNERESFFQGNTRLISSHGTKPARRPDPNQIRQVRTSSQYHFITSSNPPQTLTFPLSST